MTTLSLTHDKHKSPGKWKGIVKKYLTGYKISLDTFIFFCIIFIFNLHLLSKIYSFSFIFLPSNFTDGKWWLLFTHPFVHLTWYHLFLDAGAFLLLYSGLKERSTLRKISCVIICGASSLSAALLFSPAIYTNGLCGLSGIAHGLMAVSGLEMMEEKENFNFGLLCFLAVTFKSIYEIINGSVLFSFMHLGLCGYPLAPCHAGGVIGGIFVFLWYRNARMTKRK